MTLDDKLVESAEKIARLYQDVTGKNKDNLAYGLHIASSIASFSAGVMSIESTPPLVPLMAIYSGYEFLYAQVMKSKHKHSLIEKVDDDCRLEITKSIDAMCIYIPLGFIFSLGALATYHAYNQEYKPMRSCIALSLVQVGFILATAARYIEYTNIDPPSGKSVLAKLREGLDDFASYVGRSLRPVPQPLPIPVTSS